VRPLHCPFLADAASIGLRLRRFAIDFRRQVALNFLKLLVKHSSEQRGSLSRRSSIIAERFDLVPHAQRVQQAINAIGSEGRYSHAIPRDLEVFGPTSRHHGRRAIRSQIPGR